MSLRGNRQEEFSEQNYLFIPPVSSFSHSLFLHLYWLFYSSYNLIFILFHLSLPTLSTFTVLIPLFFSLFPHYPSYLLSFLSSSSSSSSSTVLLHLMKSNHLKDVRRCIQKADGGPYTHTAKSVRDKMGKAVENVTAVVRNTEGILLPDSLQTLTPKIYPLILYIALPLLLSSYIPLSSFLSLSASPQRA